MSNVNYGFQKTGRGVFNPILFSKKGGTAVISGFDFLTVWGFHGFLYGFFSSGIGWSRIFVLKGEIEGENGKRE